MFYCQRHRARIARNLYTAIYYIIRTDTAAAAAASDDAHTRYVYGFCARAIIFVTRPGAGQ